MDLYGNLGQKCLLWKQPPLIVSLEYTFGSQPRSMPLQFAKCFLEIKLSLIKCPVLQKDLLRKYNFIFRYSNIS